MTFSAEHMEARTQDIERILERLDNLESRVNDVEQNLGSLSNILGKMESGLSSWKQEQEFAVSRLNEKLESVAADLKANTDNDKGQTNAIAGLENEIVKINRVHESIIARIEGGIDKAWSLEQIRDAVRNSAFTANLLRWLLGLVGVSGAGVVLSAVFGLGQVNEQEFTYLETHQMLEARVDDLELELASWNRILNRLNVRVEPSD